MSGGGKGGGDSFSFGDASRLLDKQAELNRISQFGPSGNLLFGNLDAQGQFVQQPGAAAMTQETPYQQAIRGASQDTSIGLFNQIAPQASNPLTQLSFEGLPERQFQIDWSKVQGVPGADQFGPAAERASSAYYNRASQLLQPDFDLSQRRLDQRLADQGLPIGSEAYAADQNRFQSQRDQTLGNLALAAVGAGNDEAARLYQQALQGRQAQIGDQTLGFDLANQARLAGFGEQQTLRSNQLMELANLLGGQYNPVPAPQFFGPGQVDVTSPYSLAQQSQLGQQQQQNALWGNLATLGGTAGGLYALGAFSPAACWVAREVYGAHDPRWIRFREWLLTRAPKWLLRLYRRRGLRVALWLHAHPWAKPPLRWLMDRVIR